MIVSRFQVPSGGRDLKGFARMSQSRRFIPLACILGLFLPCEWALPQQNPSADAPKLPRPPELIRESSDHHQPPEQFQQLLTRIALANIPHTYEDEKEWGKTKEVWAGVKVWRDGFRIKTKRRKKEVNHGTWTRYQIRLADPERQFHVRLENVRKVTEGRIEFDAWLDAALKVSGRVSQWELGVQLISVSMEADARVRLRVRSNVGMELDPTKLPPDVGLAPIVTDAELQIVDFRLRRLSDLRGPLVKALSHRVREVLEDQIAKRRPALVKKINRQIDKNRDDLRLSLPDAIAF